VSRSDARAGVGEEGGHRERDEDAPFDPGDVCARTVDARALFVEDPPYDQHAGPDARRRDHPAIAPGNVERLALRTLEQQHQHARRDQQHGCFHE
jgi:hypothetical protein